MQFRIKGVAGTIKEAQKSAAAEITSLTQQAKADIAKDADKIANGTSDKVDYIFYFCLVMLVFTSLNIMITAYAIKIMK